MGGSQFFKTCRIVDDGKTPEFDVHGTRRIEVLPDGRVRLWLCRDFPAVPGVMPGYCVPQAILRIPAANFVWNASAIAQWALDHGMTDVRPEGPVALRPKRDRMQ
jgi:hypothetical protein